MLLDSTHRVLGPPIAQYVNSLDEDHVIVLIGEVQPEHWWERPLFNRGGGSVERCVGRGTDAVVCRLRFRLGRGGAKDDGRPVPQTSGDRARWR